MNIIESLTKYYKINSCSYLSKVIDYFKKNKIETIINENEYELAGLRIHLMYEEHYCHISIKKPKTHIYRIIHLNDKQQTNLIYQLKGIGITYKIDSTIYFIIEPLNKRKNKCYYELISLFLNIQTFYFLNHQNLENYYKYAISSDLKKTMDDLKKFKIKVNKLDIFKRDNYILSNGIIFHMLGMSPYRDKLEFLSEKEINNYKDILINPTKHFYFLGLKCIDLLSAIQEVSSKSITDVLLLKRFNNLDFYNNFCIKNIDIKDNKAIIINDKDDLDNFYNTVKSHMKTHYDLDYTIDYLRKNFKKCEEKYNTIYYGNKTQTNELMSKYMVANRKIINILLNKYITNKEDVLDIGIGKCNSIFDYNKIKIKNIYGIEPSLESIEICHKKFKQIHVIHGYGDKDWTGNIIHEYGHFKNIVLVFSIHYMLDKFDILLKNMLNASNKGTMLFIFFIDGDYILNNMIDGKFEITYDNQIMYGVYTYNEKIDKNKELIEVLFYIKDVYGVMNGSREYLVTKKFINNKLDKYFKTIKEGHFSEFNNISSLVPLDFQKKIVNLHKYLIMERKM